MRDAVPVEHLLLLLSSDAVVFVEKVQERTLGLFQGRVCTGFEIPEIREDAFLKFLGILHRSTKCLEAEGEASDDISAGDVKKIVPEHCQNKLDGSVEL